MGSLLINRRIEDDQERVTVDVIERVWKSRVLPIQELRTDLHTEYNRPIHSSSFDNTNSLQCWITNIWWHCLTQVFVIHETALDYHDVEHAVYNILQSKLLSMIGLVVRNRNL